MGKAIYLDVADRKVLATKITYDDLVILYQQYIKNITKCQYSVNVTLNIICLVKI